jgi:hypothetical protein
LQQRRQLPVPIHDVPVHLSGSADLQEQLLLRRSPEVRPAVPPIFDGLSTSMFIACAAGPRERAAALSAGDSCVAF